MIKIKRKYLDDTKEILNQLNLKPISRVYVDVCNEGVFVETRMVGGCSSDCYNNIRLSVPSMLCLSEIFDAINNSEGICYYLCKDGVECFTFTYEKEFGV